MPLRETTSAFLAAALALAIAFVAAPALAVPDDSGVSTMEEPNGFPGVCTQPCYTVQKEYEYWLPTNPDNPMPLAGNNTYIYKITHTGGTGPFVPALIGFELAVDTTQVTGAGFIATSPGVAPASTTVGATVVSWDFSTLPIADGETSKLLYVHSPLTPGPLADISVSGQAALDAPGTCPGPMYPPVPECNLQVAKEGCVVQPPDVGGDACDGKATAFSFQYTGLGCSASSNLQNPKKTLCVGTANGTQPVDILVVGKKRKRWGWGWGWWGKKHHKKTVFASVSGVNVGDVVDVDAANAGKHTLGKRVSVKISTGDGFHDIVEFDKFHTSCSQPLAPGNQFGSLLITSLTSTNGGTVDLAQDGDDCSTSIDVAPAPHCEGKIRNLTLRYMGGDCGQTVTSQDPSKVGCLDTALPTADPVRIVVADGAAAPPASNVHADISPVNGGDLVEIAATGCSHSSHNELSSTTGYWITNALTGEPIQEGFFHTSCSQPLDLGDQIGALQVFALDTTNGGTVALGSNVDYTYQVTNPNTDAVTDVTVSDDQIGIVASGATLAAGETATFTATALVDQETTNIATVTGNVAGQACIPATDSATITVNEPPDAPTICTEKIASVLLRYDGPQILGATVELTAKSFDDDPVVYGPVDLISGSTLLTKPEENGFTIDGTAHGETDLGSKLTIRIDGVEEILHTSCSTPFETDQPAPLNDPKGAPSPNWFVIDFSEKHHKDHHHDHHHDHH